MAYLKPPWFVVHVFNRIARVTGAGGSETLTVTRASNGELQRIPVVVPEVDGVKYLVSTRGESQWVKNVRANPNVTISNKSGSTDYVAEEVPEQNRQAILTAYREKCGKMVDGYFRSLPLEADHPVFALTTA